MHDAHDDVVALRRLFQERGYIKNVFDLQLAKEALDRSACGTFADTLCTFGACDDPFRLEAVAPVSSVCLARTLSPPSPPPRLPLA